MVIDDFVSGTYDKWYLGQVREAENNVVVHFLESLRETQLNDFFSFHSFPSGQKLRHFYFWLSGAKNFTTVKFQKTLFIILFTPVN